MKAILRKTAERGFCPGEMLIPSDLERPLVLKLLAFPEALERAAADSLPHVLCEYAFELAGAFSSFYQGCNIINDSDAAKRSSWLALTRHCLATLEKTLELLGMETPGRM
jgi:arginyl-tRNA synthetase